MSSLVFDTVGNLYGTTEYGGNSTQTGCGETSGCGTIFQLSPNSDGPWTETILYNFCTIYSGVSCLDGQWPVAGLVFDGAGNLYGTTSYGGSGTSGKRYGTAFKLSPPLVEGGPWTESVLYNFCAGSNNNCQDGSHPTSQLTFDASGNLYGTTSLGGTGNGGQGTVFELSPGDAGWTHTTLYNFCINGNNRICPDGDQPQAGVTFDKSGNLYSTTMSGGTKNSQGAGTVFVLTPSHGGWNHTTLLAFNPTGGPLAVPVGTVTLDSAGSVYSTASGGNGGGVFRLRRKTHTQQSFLFNIGNGAHPAAGVLIDSKASALYGTASQGGAGNGGVVYEIVASGQETVRYNFCQQTNCTDGKQPLGALIEDETGNLYGTTKIGGANNQGVVFEIIQSNR